MFDESFKAASGDALPGVRLVLEIAAEHLARRPQEALGALVETHGVEPLELHADELIRLTTLDATTLIATARLGAAMAARLKALRAKVERLNEAVRMVEASVFAEFEGAKYQRYEVRLDRAYERDLKMLETSRRARCGTLLAPVRVMAE